VLEILDVRFGAQFKKDLKLAKKRHLDIDLLKTIVNRLRAGEPLDESQWDHELSGNHKGYRECHIQPDWLLVYQVKQDILTLVLARTGTHSDIF
jgi:mRNA interferase YafQ